MKPLSDKNSHTKGAQIVFDCMALLFLCEMCKNAGLTPLNFCLILLLSY